MDFALPVRLCAGSALGLRCVLASLSERKALAKKDTPITLRIHRGRDLPLPQKRREDAHALRTSGSCRTKPNAAGPSIRALAT